MSPELFDPPPDFEFVVRYRSGEIAAGALWLDYSIHPPTKLGLHNAMLAVHDRIEILAARGRPFECALFIQHGEQAEALSAPDAEQLFKRLPHGNVKWTELHRCLLPDAPAVPQPAPPPITPKPKAPAPAAPHAHTGYDDLDAHPTQHRLDIEA